jgi:hypothetical protein
MRTFLHLNVTSYAAIFAALNSSLYYVCNIELFVIRISCEKYGYIVLMEKLKFGISTYILEQEEVFYTVFDCE